MKPNALPVAFNNSGVRLEELLGLALRPPLQEVAFGFIAVLYRRLATGALLMDGSPERFHQYLFNGARAYAFFLEHGPAEEKLTSKAEAFFDAVCCRDDAGARRMAGAAPASMDGAREYEEDFFAVRLLMDRFFGANDRTALRANLTVWEDLAADNPDTRLEVCRALVEADQRAFDDALAADLEGRVSRLREARQQETLDPDDATTTAHVSIEVLAWLELAERAGLTTAPDYRLAPGVARRFGNLQPPGPEDWRGVEPFGALDED